MAKVYLETSFFSACVSTRKGDKARGWRASSLEWWKIQRKHHELCISPEVIRELSAPGFRSSQEALAMLEGLTVLEPTDDVISFADVLVAEHVVPAPMAGGDAMHLAVATIHKVEYLLTWNVKHLANPRKQTHFAVICMRLGLAAPRIVTPDLLQEPDDA